MLTLFVVLAVLSGCQASHGTEVMSIEEKSCAEIGAVLKEFGINGITEEITQELEQSLSHLPPDILLSKTATLLMSLEDDPAANGVYSFDMEVLCEDTMYTEFLRSVSALSKGELVFENIEEDTSAVNWEEGTGSRTTVNVAGHKTIGEADCALCGQCITHCPVGYRSRQPAQ